MTAAIVKSEFGDSNEKLLQTGWGYKSVSEAGDAVKVRESEGMDAKSYMSKSKQLNFDEEVDINAVGEDRGAAVVSPTSHDLKNHVEEANVENHAIVEKTPPPERRCPISVDLEGQKEAELAGFGSGSIQQEEADKCASTDDGGAPFTDEGATGRGGKMKFDLNEGFIADDGKCGKDVTKASSASSRVI